jgi:hypothetical protein
MGHARYWALLWVMITLWAEMIYLNNKSMSTRLSLHRFNQTLLRARPPAHLIARHLPAHHRGARACHTSSEGPRPPALRGPW